MKLLVAIMCLWTLSGMAGPSDEAVDLINTKIEAMRSVNKDMFGVKLGDRIPELSKKTALKAHDTDHGIGEDLGEFNPTKVYRLSGAVNLNDKIHSTHLYTIQNRVYGIRVFFNDETERNFEILQTALKKKYGEPKKTESGINYRREIFEYSFPTGVDAPNKKVEIRLERVDALFDDEVRLSYLYKDMNAEVKSLEALLEKKDREGKAEEIGDQL